MDIKPCIIFCNTRDNCKSRALTLSENLPEQRNNPSELTVKIQKLLNRQNLVKIEQDLINSISKGVGFHHSGLDNRLKKLVEDLFLNQDIDFLFCTTGLAYGMNLPAKSVILCDMKMYDTLKGRQLYIPVHLYQQMAGRAGRPQFGNEGFSNIVVKTRNDRTVATKFYIPGDLATATSHISEDAFFRKAILELVYSERARPEQIIEFFNNTLYNFQSLHRPSPFSSFDLNSEIAIHIKFLEKNGFMRFSGAPGYQLSDLGRITLDFLFTTFTTYELKPFLEIQNYLKNRESIELDFDLLYTINKLFNGTRLSKIPREKVPEIEKFFEELGIEDVSHSEYSAYAFWNGWLRNMPIEIIEDRYKVYSSTIEFTSNELYQVSRFVRNLSEVLGIPMINFDTSLARIRRGLREDEIPFIGLYRFGRNLIRNLHEQVQDVYTKPPWNFKGSTLDILIQLYRTVQKDEFIRAMDQIRQISEIRGLRIYEFIEKQVK
jgi:helicase